MYDVNCGKCGTSDAIAVEGREHAIRTLRINGWQRTGKYGWVCPKCLREGDVAAEESKAKRARKQDDQADLFKGQA